MKMIFKVIMIIGVFLPAFSYAAPELILTWKASSYVPTNYKGKALPVAGTIIEASALLVDGGKVISLAPYDINWYTGEDRIIGGNGVSNARITTPTTGQDSIELRVNVAKYKDQPLDAFITIPIVRPELFILRKPAAQRKDFSIIPYFWNIITPNELMVTWDDNGDSVTAYATNKKNEMEFTQLTILKQ